MKKTQITYGTSYRIARTSLGAGFMLLFLACIVSHSSMPSFLESIVDYIQVVLNQPAIPQAAWIGFSMVTLSCYPYLLIRQKIKTQRLRNKLASDLHDDLGSLLNSVNIYTELAMIKGEPGYLLKIKESRTISSMKYGSCLLTGRIAAIRNLLNKSYFTFITILVQGNGIYAAALLTTCTVPQNFI